MCSSKIDELSALNKIEEILNQIDKDGYVNSAFKGVIELAKSNIQNDFCLSPYDTYSVADAILEENQKMRIEIAQLKDVIKDLANLLK